VSQLCFIAAHASVAKIGFSVFENMNDQEPSAVGPKENVAIGSTSFAMEIAVE